jgi:hypothetical protein
MRDSVIRTAAATRPIDGLRRLVLGGLICALITAGVVATLSTVKASRHCHGPFNHGFSSGFDRYRCDLAIKLVEGGPQIEITLPW